MEEKQINTNRPDPLASTEEKATNAYGIKICQAIQQEWFAGGMIQTDTPFNARHVKVRNNRLINRGQQPTQKYKDHVSKQQGDLSYLNLDWTPINIVEKFTNIVRNGITDEFYNVDVRSIDRLSLLALEDKRLQHKTNMMAKPMLERAKALGMPDLRPKGFVPEDEEELNLYMEIKDRPKHEIAEEVLIDFVKSTNNNDSVKRAVNKDLVVNGLGVMRCWTDKNDGVKYEYVDIESYGHSFVNNNDFSDAYYHFVVDTITLSQLKTESDFEDDDLRKIAKMYGGKNISRGGTTLEFDSCSVDDLLDFNIDIMRFSYKTSREIVYKKYLDKNSKPKKVAKRTTEYQVPEGAEDSRMSKRLDTWYEGNYVVGSNAYIYDYKECENLAKDQMNKVLPPFIAEATDIYRNQLKSFLDDVIPISEQMQYINLKLQHLISELKPDLIVLDLDALADLEGDVKGGDNSKNWEKALSILNVKGVVLQKRVDTGEMGIKDTPAARPMASQQGSALIPLLNVWAHYYEELRNVTGINPARDGSAAQNSLVGVNQMMQLASNTATKHIVDAANNMEIRLCNTISARVKGIFTFKGAEKIKKLYIQAVGKNNVDPIQALKNRHLHEFGFNIQLVPSKEELDELKTDLSVALQEGTIDVSEKHEALRIARSNIKQAGEYMRFIRSRNIKQKMKQDQLNIKTQAEANNRNAQEKIQAEMQSYQSKKQIDMQFEMNKSQLKLQEEEALLQIKAPTEDKKFEQQVYLEKIKGLKEFDKLNFQKKEKDDRLKEASTYQGELIKQRADKSNPKDFTKKFDLDAIING